MIFPLFLPLSTSNVSMSEGTFCRVEVHIRIVQSMFYVRYYIDEVHGSQYLHHENMSIRYK